MPRLAVVLDTNLYRGTSPALLESVRAAERSASVVAVANFYTVVELAAHLADPADTDYKHSLAALRKVASHTSLYDGARNYIPITGERDTLLSASLFGKESPRIRSAAEVFGNFVQEVARLGGPIPTEWRPQLVALRDRAEAIKRQFVQHGESAASALRGEGEGDKWRPLVRQPERRTQVLEQIDAGTGLRILSRHIVGDLASSNSVNVSDEELEQLAIRLEERCGVALHFYNLLMRKLASDGYNFDKNSRRTAVWDYHLAFAAGANVQKFNVPLTLVTRDTTILQAASLAERKDAVLHWDDYLAQLDLHARSPAA